MQFYILLQCVESEINKAGRRTLRDIDLEQNSTLPLSDIEH